MSSKIVNAALFIYLFIGWTSYADALHVALYAPNEKDGNQYFTTTVEDANAGAASFATFLTECEGKVEDKEKFKKIVPIMTDEAMLLKNVDGLPQAARIYAKCSANAPTSLILFVDPSMAAKEINLIKSVVMPTLRANSFTVVNMRSGFDIRNHQDWIPLLAELLTGQADAPNPFMNR